MEYSKYSYVLGYYIHLLTDIEWSKFFNEKKKNALYNKKLKEDASFIWTIKKDWYGLDFLYLEKNPNFIFHTIFKNIDQVPDYIDYFPKGALMKQVKYITEYYLGDNEETKENFIYLNEEEMDKFIDDTSKKLASVQNVLSQMSIPDDSSSLYKDFTEVVSSYNDYLYEIKYAILTEKVRRDSKDVKEDFMDSLYVSSNETYDKIEKMYKNFTKEYNNLNSNY